MGITSTLLTESLELSVKVRYSGSYEVVPIRDLKEEGGKVVHISGRTKYFVLIE